MDRRSFLKLGSASALGLGLNIFSPALIRNKILAGPSASNKKMLFVFLRGGNDALNTVIPRGDSLYSTASRPTLFIPEGSAINSGNGFAQFHPAMQPLMEVYNNSSINGVSGPGNVAFLHRIGYAGQSQSHFDSQQYWENGTPGSPDLSEGMIYRKISQTMDPINNGFVAAGLDGSLMTSLKGSAPLPAFSRPESFTFGGSGARLQKFLGQLPSTPIGDDGSGLLGAYGGGRTFPTKPLRELVYSTGQNLVESIETVQNALNQGSYTPENGAVYPDNTFGDRLSDSAMLFKRTDVQILGINLGGFDTHQNQGQINGQHAALLDSISRGIQALSRDLQSQWDDLTVVVMSEFGRTSRENGSVGTDHAHAGAMIVAGGGVQGGVYNCDNSTWADGDMESISNRYVDRKTDYRSVFGEIFRDHFGDSQATVESIVPTYAAAAQLNPNDFQPLGFLS